MASAQDKQPTCEDYDSDQSEQGYEFSGRSPANAANVSTKRSHPDDLNKEKPPPQERVPTNLDLRSDSGYSSYTAATVSSTNSAQSAPFQRSPPAAAPPTALPEAPQPPPPRPPQPQQQPPPPPSTKTRRPTHSHSEQSRPKLHSRTTSQSSKPLVIKQRRPTITQDPHPERPERERLPRRDSRVEPECTDPKCTTCGPNALPQHVRPGIKPTQSARDIDRLSADTRSMRSDPAYYQSPPSPTHVRRPPSYRQEAAIVQPSVNPRRRSSTTARPRLMGYNSEPNSQYYVPGAPAPYPSPPQEHGPPPSNSAQWRQMPQYQHMGSMAPPVVAYGASQAYPGAYPYNHTPPPYDGPQRPNMPPRASFNSARNGSAPLVTQAPSREQQYSARYGHPQSTAQARFPPQLQLQEGAYESDSASETGSSQEDDDDDEYYERPDPNDPRNRRALMAPLPPKIEQAKPKSKSKKQQRPPIRHANTSQVVDERPSRRMSLSQPPAQSQSLVIDERRRKRTSRTIEEPSRRASVSRPPPPSRQIQSEYPSHRGQIVVANSSKSERRRSSQVYEQAYDHHLEDKRAAKAAKEARARAREEEEEARREQEQYEAELAHQKRLNRNSRQIYQAPGAFDSEDESESEESEDGRFPPEAPAPPPPQARRRRPTDAGKGKERVLEHKTKRIESAAEEYISARRGAPGPLNDPIHNAARHSRTISQPSHSGSSGSDKSRSNRTAVTNENNEIRLRVDANAPLSLQFNGDMEGRTLRMIPAENGMADLVISGGRDRENVYHNSDRGSLADDRKALVPKQPRRQVEELTDNSLRSSRRRRDSQVIREQRIERSSGQQRPLRQRAHTSSYYGE